MTRREFLFSSVACGAVGCAIAEEAVATNAIGEAALPLPQTGIRIRFLGSGASVWKPEWAKEKPFMRRQTSALLENRVLIDFTSCSFDHLPEGCRPEALFQTHSHGDHYNPSALVKVGVKRLYVHASWVAAARIEVAAAAEKLGLPAPEVIALEFAKPVVEGDLTITPVPANHSTSRVTGGVLERTCLYLIEKGPARMLYATDTAGVPNDAARMLGIDPIVSDANYPTRFAGNPFVSPPKALTALVMEATMGNVADEHVCYEAHSGVPTVARFLATLRKFNRFQPPAGQSAYVTHLGVRYRNWPSEKIDAELPDGIKSAFDGLELVLG